MSVQTDIPSLAKGLVVFGEVVNSDQGLTFSELHRNLGVPKTTLGRMINTLLNAGFLAKENDRFIIGPIGFQLSLKAQSRIEIKEIAAPFLEEISSSTKETSHLLVPFGKQGLIVAVSDGKNHVRVSQRPGTAAHLYCSAAGKVLLAFRTGPDGIQSFYGGETLQARTPYSITDYSALRNDLLQVLRNGYAVDNREYYVDVRCLAAPIFDGRNETVGALGVTAPESSFPHEKTGEIAAIVTRVAREFSRKLGANL